MVIKHIVNGVPGLLPPPYRFAWKAVKSTRPYWSVMAFTSVGAALLLSGIIILGSHSKAFAADANRQLVIFTADWCAGCRDLMPIVKNLAAQQQIPLLEINVDNANAPEKASQQGLAVPNRELPQIYLIQEKESRLLFDGTGYRLGQKEGTRRSLERKLGG